jgi:hypothetical protein
MSRKAIKKRLRPKLRLVRKVIRAVKRRNGQGEDAAALSEAFHGRPVQKVYDYTIEQQYQNELADLGRLLRLDVQTGDASARRLGFRGSNVRLYFIGGDQSIDFDELGLDDMERELVAVGLAGEIEYHTSKDFHDFAPVDYTHEFGEEGGEIPMLLYDTLNEQFLLAGGSYRVERPGIIN